MPGRSRYGQGRHRQPWLTSTCPRCGVQVEVRRTLPGQPLHVRAHFDDDGALCAVTTMEQVA